MSINEARLRLHCIVINFMVVNACVMLSGFRSWNIDSNILYAPFKDVPPVSPIPFLTVSSNHLF